MKPNKIVIKIKRLSHAEGLSLPSYESPHAAGMDLRAAIQEVIILNPGEWTLIPTGFCIALPEGYEAQIRPRSGLALKHGITVLNAPGTIDADYRGEVGVILINHGDTPFHIERGDRIAQMVIASTVKAEWSVTVELDETERGDRGFGSSGLS